MNFTDWYDSLSEIPKLQNCSRNSMEFLVDLKATLEELKINEGIIQMYVKKNNKNEIVNFYMFYEDKLSVLDIRGIAVMIKDLFYSKLEKVVYGFEMNSEHNNTLRLCFTTEDIFFNPDSDANYIEVDQIKYRKVLNEVYQLVK